MNKKFLLLLLLVKVNAPTVRVLNVGQGSCTVVDHENTLAVFDSGTSSQYMHGKYALPISVTRQVDLCKFVHTPGLVPQFLVDGQDEGYESSGSDGSNVANRQALSAVEIPDIVKAFMEYKKESLANILFFISHQDKDHYGEMHQILEEMVPDRSTSQIKVIAVLGGNWMQKEEKEEFFGAEKSTLFDPLKRVNAKVVLPYYLSNRTIHDAIVKDVVFGNNPAARMNAFKSLNVNRHLTNPFCGTLEMFCQEFLEKKDYENIPQLFMNNTMFWIANPVGEDPNSQSMVMSFTDMGTTMADKGTTIIFPGDGTQSTAQQINIALQIKNLQGLVPKADLQTLMPTAAKLSTSLLEKFKALHSKIMEAGHKRVLCAPHHGAEDPSAFLEIFKPHLVIFSVGVRAGYGHPKKSAVALYDAWAQENDRNLIKSNLSEQTLRRIMGIPVFAKLDEKDPTPATATSQATPPVPASGTTKALVSATTQAQASGTTKAQASATSQATPPASGTTKAPAQDEATFVPKLFMPTKMPMLSTSSHGEIKIIDGKIMVRVGVHTYEGQEYIICTRRSSNLEVPKAEGGQEPVHKKTRIEASQVENDKNVFVSLNNQLFIKITTGQETKFYKLEQILLNPASATTPGTAPAPTTATATAPGTTKATATAPGTAPAPVTSQAPAPAREVFEITDDDEDETDLSKTDD